MDGERCAEQVLEADEPEALRTHDAGCRQLAAQLFAERLVRRLEPAAEQTWPHGRRCRHWPAFVGTAVTIQ